MSDTPELLPCPFCTCVRVFVYDDEIADATYVTCPQCSMQGPMSEWGESAYAVTAWNRQAALADLATAHAEVQQLRLALDIAWYDLRRRDIQYPLSIAGTLILATLQGDAVLYQRALEALREKGEYSWLPGLSAARSVLAAGDEHA